MILADNKTSFRYAGPGQAKPSISMNDITLISKEYAYNTMLKAGIMRNKPQVPAFYDQPVKSSLSPHYRRAREL